MSQIKTQPKRTRKPDMPSTESYIELPAPGAAALPEPIAVLARRIAHFVAQTGIPPMRALPDGSAMMRGAESDRIHTYDESCAQTIVEQMREQIAAIPRTPGQVAALRVRYAGGYYFRVELATCGRK